MQDAEPTLTTTDWWRQGRLKYNKGLVVAGLLAFACYAIVYELVAKRLGPEAEITLFTTLFQGIGYLFMMGVANICYNLGALAERLIRPKDLDRFRRISFALGFWGSVALPFAIPVLVLLSAYFAPYEGPV